MTMFTHWQGNMFSVDDEHEWQSVSWRQFKATVHFVKIKMKKYNLMFVNNNMNWSSKLLYKQHRLFVCVDIGMCLTLFCAAFQRGNTCWSRHKTTKQSFRFGWVRWTRAMFCTKPGTFEWMEVRRLCVCVWIDLLLNVHIGSEFGFYFEVLFSNTQPINTSMIHLFTHTQPITQNKYPLQVHVLSTKCQLNEWLSKLNEWLNGWCSP